MPLINKDSPFCNTAIFSDESKFKIFDSDGKFYVRRKTKAGLNKEKLKATMTHGGGHVMVWSCMYSAGVESLEFIEGIMRKMQ